MIEYFQLTIEYSRSACGGSILEKELQKKRRHLPQADPG
ncbi:hypothetical protein D1BOALGB6SA_188 [Olavius sp. associated proteobacterium Delta 1]|nr:hypothetical protein D1BOALGB6SA_188 [Olavius sp. associated proteobacterium Delta 1]